MRACALASLTVAVLLSGCDQTRRRNRNVEQHDAAVAVGKLVITPPSLDAARGSMRDAGEAFLEEQLGMLRGDEIRREAEAAVKRAAPRLDPGSVVVLVARIRGSSLVSVSGRGGPPEANVALVNALMEAYVAAVRPKETERTAAALAGSSAAEADLKEAERQWNAFRVEHDLNEIRARLPVIESRLKRLAVARGYYEQELAMAAKLSLEQDLIRRQASPVLPEGMPGELAALARNTLTVGELAYLAAMRQPNSPALGAALKEAAKDHGERVTSNRKQLEIVNEMNSAVQAEIDGCKANQRKGAELEAHYKKAEAKYREMKAGERNVGAGPNSSVHPVVSILERAGATPAGAPKAEAAQAP